MGTHNSFDGGKTPFGLGSSSDVSGWTTREENSCGQKRKIAEAIEIRIVSTNSRRHLTCQHATQTTSWPVRALNEKPPFDERSHGDESVVHIIAAFGLTSSLTTGEPSPLSSPVEYPFSASPESDPFASGRSVHTDDDSTRRSIDTQSDYDPLPRSSSLLEHEHGVGPSGLDRIRQQFPSRVLTLPNMSTSSLVPPNSQHRSPSPRSSSTSRARSARALSFENSTTLEDLHRFPSESLHSFSFAQQPEELLQTRQNILKRSIDFMRDRFGRSASGAQSRTYGDIEIQSTADSLSQANLSEREDPSDLAGLARGPLSGPADVDTNNVFDKAFTDYKTPVEESLETASQRHVSVPEGTAESIHSLSPLPGDHVSHQKREMRTDPSGRVSFKRTFTDGSSAGLQSKLMETLAQPYTATDALSSVSSSTLGLGFPVPALHTHSSKWNRVSQAVFRTESQAPWTILAANDLSCLVFGVTQAELRKLSILEVVQNDQRQWLESRLRDPSTDAASNPPSTRTNQTNSKSMRFPSGVTAQLFRKPSARDRPVRRSRTDDGYGSSTRNSRESNHPTTKSRGVLLCGDVVPIRKRNGTQGSASIWVMEKRGGLIWVLEEITENIAYIDCDPSWNVTNTQGETEKIWGPDVTKSGRRITELLPRLPQECLEIPPSQATAKLSEMKYFAARNSAGFCSPVAVAKADESAHRLRISSFPHVAGMMVLSSSTLKVISSNSVFSAALFGQERPEGLHITDLLPGFDHLLDVLSEEDDGPLMDGMVIPEQSFRRARTLSVLQEGKDNVASVFLEPAGLTAKHRDGSTMAADVQLRVVKSGTMFSKDEEKKVDNHDDDDEDSEAESDDTIAATELLYALWVTYSRQVHSNGPAANLPSSHSNTREQSQDTTPTAAPGSGVSSMTTASQQPESPRLAEQTSVETRLPLSTLSQQLSEAASQPLTDKPVQPMPEMKSNGPGPQEVPAKRTISDYAILEEMGQGAYGEVKLVRLKKNPSKKVVLKYVTKKRILVDTWTRDRRLGTVPLEIHVLDYLRRDGLKHPNIVEMEGFFEDDVNYYIEMKPHGLPGMDLFDYIELKANMDESECREIFRQVVDAIHHLHIKARVVHRDIKDENVILDGEGKIKLIDFGSAAYIKNGPFDVFVGTIAPEVLQGKSYGGKEQDVWALGILLYTIVYKENPFYNIDEILDHPLRVPYLPFSEDCIDLIRKMLDRDVDSRYTITEVMEHPWMVNG